MTTKPCPVCGCNNAESDFFCQNCGIEISLAAAGAKPTPPPAAPASPARVCPKCGARNEPVFLLCTVCGFDLAAAHGPRLVLIAGAEQFECRDGDVLGRDGTIARSFFSGIRTVSRQHARLTRRDGRWFVTVSPSVPNITELDGREIPRGAEQLLTGAHVLKLSTQCEVGLKLV